MIAHARVRRIPETKPGLRDTIYIRLTTDINGLYIEEMPLDVAKVLYEELKEALLRLVPR